MNKKERRKQRHLRNSQKDRDTKQEAWDSGKLIYENHNNGFFSPEFSLAFARRVVEKIKAGDTEFYKLRKPAIDAVLMYSPELERGDDWYFLKQKLEEYWDDKQ